MVRFKKVVIYLVLFSFFISGCGESYPKEKVAQYVVDLCKKEYGINVIAKAQGKTLGIFYEFKEGLFDETLLPTTQALEKISDAFMVLSRVALSTDADIKFIKLIAIDESKPGLKWSVARYVDDTRKLLASFIAKEESDLRTEIDYTFDPELLTREDLTDFSLEDIKLEDFLAKQIAKKIRLGIMQAASSGEFIDVKISEGSFDRGRFAFVIQTELKKKILKGKVLDKYLLNLGLTVAGSVLKAYDFRDFNAVTVVDRRNSKMLVARRDALLGITDKNIKK